MVSVRSLSALAFLLHFLEAAGERALRKRDLGIASNCPRLHVEILISPLVERGKVRQLEVQWEHSPLQKGDWIGLFASDPFGPMHSNYLPPLLQKIWVTSVHGWANTSINEHHIEADYLGYHERCLNYYAAYFDEDNNILTVTCLRTEPNWMWRLKSEIGSRRLRQVFIPGTHDSASYAEYNSVAGETLVKKYSITQDESVLAQLIYGVRYVDLRVGYYERNEEKWWANHGVIRIHPLRVILKDIRRFINRTKEIVFLDVQEFPVGFGKTREIHKKLVSYLEKELGDLAASPNLGWDATFDQVWKAGNRLIISYDDREAVAHSRFLWPAVVQKWGNVRTVHDLYMYLSGVIERPPSAAWSAMAELTPSTLDVILDRLKGLRNMAEMVNHDVTTWFRRKNWAPKTNIVAVDFVRSSGIVRSAIEWNKFQGQCPLPPF